MGRLILVPQYPTPLRYQEWWYSRFQWELAGHFTEVVVLGDKTIKGKQIAANQGMFSPLEQAMHFELTQIKEYIQLKLQKGDVLLLNDISFPGLFAQVLVHKRPDKCFAICHATAKNKYDYFSKMRRIKYPIEKSTAKLFDTIFVGSQYHKKKLGWRNIAVLPLPHPLMDGIPNTKIYDIVTASRKGLQKRTKKIEKFAEKVCGTPLVEVQSNTWEEYYRFLGASRVLLITAKEETYGYQIIDALKNGCIPIAPNALSYSELLPKDLLYDSNQTLATILRKVLAGEREPPTCKPDIFFYHLIKTMKSNG